MFDRTESLIAATALRMIDTDTLRDNLGSGFANVPDLGATCDAMAARIMEAAPYSGDDEPGAYVQEVERMQAERQALPQAALDAFPEKVRWTIANALRAAADKWDAPTDDAPDGYAQTIAHPGVSEQFKRQAADARNLAEQFENC